MEFTCSVMSNTFATELVFRSKMAIIASSLSSRQDVRIGRSVVMLKALQHVHKPSRQRS